MRTDAAPTIRLVDYAPPQYTVEAIALDFALSPNATRVVSKLNVRREPGTDLDARLHLDGEDVRLISVAIDGSQTQKFAIDGDLMTLRDLPGAETFQVEIVTEVDPEANSQLSGLYRTNNVYCTQCEAQGFRRITYFPDRPDVLSTYTVRIEAGVEDCPVLLSNGNPGEKGTLPGGRHFAVWHDPWPKPSYLFALVAGKLDVLTDDFTTVSGNSVSLGIYVESGKAPLARHAMDAIKRSMAWDEEAYGREYDLDVFNIVAVSDFNMGAMENKGLNVFNDKYVLASPELATDLDYAHIEAIVAHEYFHNWTGNRITCRDWFQLCLKEGLTVFRDQSYMEELHSAAVQRVTQVRGLKASQFSEDAGPLSHPVRPHEYKEINNFYTATVYQKGAELVRMLATMAGKEGYRAALDLYFERHDGEAAVVEDFLACFRDTCNIDTAQFQRWYEERGTPELKVTEDWDEKAGRFTLHLEQSLPNGGPMVIPLSYALLKADGSAVDTEDEHDGLFILREPEAKLTFDGLSARPLPSLLRNFSAPVRLVHDEPAKARLVRARHDTNLYARFEALNGLALDQLSQKHSDRGELLDCLTDTAMDEKLDPEFRAQAITLPSPHDVVRHIRAGAEPLTVAAVRNDAINAFGERLGESGMAYEKELRERIARASDRDAVGLRALANALLPPLLGAAGDGFLSVVQQRYDRAENMTDRLAALQALALAGVGDAALSDFYDRYRQYPLVIDKWFSVNAAIPGDSALERVTRLTKHRDFTLKTPNRARALLGAFAATNLSGFHRADAKAYEFYCGQLKQIDALNPQASARMLSLMDAWTMLAKPQRKAARGALEGLAASDGLSTDLREMLERSLK